VTQEIRRPVSRLRELGTPSRARRLVGRSQGQIANALRGHDELSAAHTLVGCTKSCCSDPAGAAPSLAERRFTRDDIALAFGYRVQSASPVLAMCKLASKKQ
jgi:hypothetical protein